MAGRLIAVVGPSGVGKDTVMRALATTRPDLHLVRRVITRKQDDNVEQFDSVTEPEFQRRLAKGAFVLHWRAHGLNYGIPVTVRDVLASSNDALVNLSRSVLLEAQEKFDEVVVVALSASLEILAQRLGDRGRDTEDEIARRLSRADDALPDGLHQVIEIANDGPLEDTVAQALAQLFPEKE